MSDIVREYYDRDVSIEWSRMERHPLEFEITKRHIDSVLKPGSDILDLGGGPGRYSFHYAALGHRVSLVDLSPANIAFARAKQDEAGVALRECRVGDARALSFYPDESFDLVLCMGPLNHLVSEVDRRRAMDECARLARPGGHIVYAFVTKTAQTISLIKRAPEKIAAWEKALRLGRELGLNDTAFDTGFTEAFFVDPLEVEPMIESEGFEVIRVAGAEGLAAQSEEKLKALSPETFRSWVDLSYETSTDRSLLGASQHLLGIIRKRGR
jgi:S-adenosylmethionine-dependent methyltransferase